MDEPARAGRRGVTAPCGAQTGSVRLPSCDPRPSRSHGASRHQDIRLDDSPVPESISNLLYMDFGVTGLTAITEMVRQKIDQWKTRQKELLAALTDEELMRRAARDRDS